VEAVLFSGSEIRIFRATTSFVERDRRKQLPVPADPFPPMGRKRKNLSGADRIPHRLQSSAPQTLRKNLRIPLQLKFYNALKIIQFIQEFCRINRELSEYLKETGSKVSKKARRPD
jgi:hypothetical protein